MKRTIYFPDDLDEQIKEHPDLNLSAICQQAVRAALNGDPDDLPTHGKKMKTKYESAAIAHLVDAANAAGRNQGLEVDPEWAMYNVGAAITSALLDIAAAIRDQNDISALK